MFVTMFVMSFIMPIFVGQFNFMTEVEVSSIREMNINELVEKYKQFLLDSLKTRSILKIKIAAKIEKSLPTIDKYLNGNGTDLILMRAVVEEALNQLELIGIKYE